MTPALHTPEQHPNWFIDRLTLYQNANSSPESVKRNFLIRIAEFELIVADLRSKRKGDPVQHELILGRRGSGKSTLLRRIQIEIDEQPDLAAQYVAINLAEEQGAIYRLSDLWFEVLQELAIRFSKRLDLRSFDSFDDEQAYARYLYSEIHQLLLSAQRRAVLLLDNLDRILENFDDDAHLLRETLINYPSDIQIIGGSTRMNEHFWKYDQPFYDFFRRHRLEGLTFEEIHVLLNHWALEMQLPKLMDYALRFKGRIEAIRILTDGLPRALQYFIQVLLHDDNLYGFDYLKKVMDKATPLYQERLNSLTPPLRKIVQEMAFLWEACPTKTLVEKCRMESKLLSSNLKQLDRYGIVDTLETGKKNHLYRISERFFNMWLIVTQGNPDQRRRAKYLTLFLESWYDEQELRSLAREHLGALRNKKISFDKAMALSKGLSQSQFLPTEERDELIELTRALNPADEAAELPRKFSEIFEETEKLVAEGQFEAALTTLQEIENEADGVKFFLMAWCFESLSKFHEAETWYLQAIEKGHVNAMFNLAVLYANQGKTELAETLYLQAIEKGQVDAMYNLAILYKNQGKTELAETMYQQAIEKGHVGAKYNLAILYAKQGKTELAETMYQQAIEKGDVNAMNNLAVLYAEQGKTELAETMYQQAIEKGDVNAMNNLAVLYAEQGKTESAETMYLQAIEKGNVAAMNNLANLYKNQGKTESAETRYLQAIEKGNVAAMYNLAILYDNQGKTESAETRYLQAIEKGNVAAMNNLANLYADQGKTELAETLYLQAIEKGHVAAMNNLANLYKNQGKTELAEIMYQQAIEKGDVNAKYNLAILYYNQNQHPAKALTLMQQFLDATQDKDAYQSLVILELWNGQLDGLREKVERVLTQQKLEDLEDFINDLLHHQQVHLVLSLFESEEHGKALRQRYELLYYAALLLAGRTEDNLLLRIPPEVLPTVEEIVKKVREKQAFYGYGGG